MHDATLLLDRLATETVRARLVGAVRRAAGAESGFVRVEVPVRPMDPLAWLQAQNATETVYWHGRGELAIEACLGIADEVAVDTLGELHAVLGPRLTNLPAGARYYGAARFDATRSDDPTWNAFGRVRFVLPRIVLRVEGDKAALAVQYRPGTEDLASVLAQIDALVFPDDATPLDALPLPIDRRDAPGRDAWMASIRWALGRFSAGALEKVVLARRARFAFEENLDPYTLLRTLQTATPGCYHSLIGVDQGSPEAAAFIAASPERLLRIEHRLLETEAVAGTRPRAEGRPDDRRLRDELLASDKDRREHAFVREAILDALAPVTDSLYTDDETSALTLARGRHLYAALRGTLCPDVSVFDVLAALHPTPAVGGTPQDGAMAAIAEREPFDRGLYAGPIGWIGAESAELAVGIRSGLVHGEYLDLFSGAGIVAGSDPASEWAEIEHKIGDFARVLGLDDGG